MPCPAHTDPFTAMAAAVEHIAAGRVAEVELEWWADPPEGQPGMEHRMTITLRAKSSRGGTMVVTHNHHPAGQAPVEPAADPPPLLTDPLPRAPDDLSGLDDAG